MRENLSAVRVLDMRQPVTPLRMLCLHCPPQAVARGEGKEEGEGRKTKVNRTRHTRADLRPSDELTRVTRHSRFSKI